MHKAVRMDMGIGLQDRERTFWSDTSRPAAGVTARSAYCSCASEAQPSCCPSHGRYLVIILSSRESCSYPSQAIVSALRPEV